jgi:FG-GAP-like repeat
LNASGGTWSGQKAFTVQGPPASTPQSPSGSGTNATPTYRWSAAGGGVTYYVLSVIPLDGGTAAFAVPFDPVICNGGICSATPAAPANVLRAGSYRWQVRGWNTTGGGDWSSPMTFTVTGPPMPTPLSPTGSGTNATPTYSWTAVGGGVTFYVLSVSPVATDGTPAFEIWYPPNASNCPGTTCSVMPPNLLKAGPYTWQIRARNAAGPGDLSNPVAFTVTGPPIPNPMSPSGVLTFPVPTFSWGAVGGNVHIYNLGVSKADGTGVYEVSYDLSACLPTGTCSVTPNHPLNVGSYKWAVRGRNMAGPGGWSTPMAFAVQAPNPPIPLAPTGKIPTQTPTFSWTVSAGAMDYTLSVLKPNGSTLYEQGAGTSACANGICSLTPAGILGVGEPYRWRVRGQHIAGVGEWSTLADFHVASLEDCDREFVTADFNGDGFEDGLCQTQGDVYVALGNGDGSFGVAQVWLVHSFNRLLFGDFDGDGKTDLADVNVQTGAFLVARSLAPNSAAFAALTSWGIATGVWGSAVYTCQGESLIAGAERIDADLMTDVYCRDSSLKFFLGTSTGKTFKFKVIDDPPSALQPVQEYIYAGPRPLAITGSPR